MGKKYTCVVAVRVPTVSWSLDESETMGNGEGRITRNKGSILRATL
jgi:hypothetical protein